MIILFVFGVPRAAAAECVAIRNFARVEKHYATFVFDGTVLRVEQMAADGTRTPVEVDELFPREKDYYARQFAATLDVHRVWKGDVSKTFTVYFVWNWDGPVFKVGQRQIVFAHHQSQKPPGSDPSAPLRNPWVGGCSGYAANDKDVLKQLGRARKPKQMP